MVDTKTLDALYNVNKHAKKYGRLGTENYRRGKKTTAQKNSHRKEALYDVKEQVLSEILDDVCRVEEHIINGDNFYCLYFECSDGEEWSYHSPIENLDLAENTVEDRYPIEDWESGEEKERSDMSLKASLLHIEDEFDVNANEYLPKTHLWYGSSRYFSGWTYLGE